MTDADLEQLFHDAAMAGEGARPVPIDVLSRVAAARRHRSRATAMAFVLPVLLAAGLLVVAQYGDRGVDAVASRDDRAVCTAPAPPEPPARPSQSGSPAPGGNPGMAVVELTVDANCLRLAVGEELLLRVTADGDTATPGIVGTLIDGATSARTASCARGSEQPAAPRAGRTTEVLRHVYAHPGVDRIRISAATQCSPFRGGDSVELTIEVVGESDPSATPRPTPPPPCSEEALNAGDLRPAAVYEAVLKHFLTVVGAGDHPRLYVTNHAVVPVGGQDSGSTAAFSGPLLNCLRAGGSGFPPLVSVDGFDDPDIPREGPGIARLTDGRLIELSAVDAEGPETAEVFVSINGGGGFGLRGQTLRVVRGVDGRWSVDRVLGEVIA